MAVTTVAKPGDFMCTFTLFNRSTPHPIQYGILANGKVYRERINRDTDGSPGVAPGPGGHGTYVDTTLTIPDISTVTDL